MTSGELKFVNVGAAAFACVIEGRVVGVLYRDVAHEHVDWGDHDQKDIFWWYWMAVDKPFNHLGLEVPTRARPDVSIGDWSSENAVRTWKGSPEFTKRSARWELEQRPPARRVEETVASGSNSNSPANRGKESARCASGMPDTDVHASGPEPASCSPRLLS